MTDHYPDQHPEGHEPRQLPVSPDKASQPERGLIPTKSAWLREQMLGRALRANPDTMEPIGFTDASVYRREADDLRGQFPPLVNQIPLDEAIARGFVRPEDIPEDLPEGYRTVAEVASEVGDMTGVRNAIENSPFAGSVTAEGKLPEEALPHVQEYLNEQQGDK